MVGEPDVKVQYINLARRKDRDERFLSLNAGLAEFERVEAVDGRSLRVEELVARNVLAEPLNEYTLGGIGSALSHRRRWEECVASGAPVTVAEDDAVFNRRYGRTLAEFEEKLADELKSR